MTAAERRAASHAAMRDAYDVALVSHYCDREGKCDSRSYRAGFLAALKFAADSVPRLTLDEAPTNAGAVDVAMLIDATIGNCAQRLEQHAAAIVAATPADHDALNLADSYRMAADYLRTEVSLSARAESPRLLTDDELARVGTHSQEES